MSVRSHSLALSSGRSRNQCSSLMILFSSSSSCCFSSASSPLCMNYRNTGSCQQRKHSATAPHSKQNFFLIKSSPLNDLLFGSPEIFDFCKSQRFLPSSAGRFWTVSLHHPSPFQTRAQLRALM